MEFVQCHKMCLPHLQSLLMIVITLFCRNHYSDVIMGAMASQITGVSIVYSTVCSGADQRKHQSSASLAFVRGIHRSPQNSPHKGPVTRKMFPFHDVIMICTRLVDILHLNDIVIRFHHVLSNCILNKLPAIDFEDDKFVFNP